MAIELQKKIFVSFGSFEVGLFASKVVNSNCIKRVQLFVCLLRSCAVIQVPICFSYELQCLL